MRAGAAFELGNWTDDRAEPLLFEALLDPAVRVRQMAVAALFARRPDRDRAPIIQQLRTAVYGEPATPYLDPDYREALELNLPWCKELPLVTWFRDGVLDDDAEIRRMSAWVLGECGEQEARPALERALSDSEATVRDIAREALRKLEARGIG